MRKDLVYDIHKLSNHKEKENQRMLLERLMNHREILEVSSEELYSLAEGFLEKKSGFSGMDGETLEEHQAIALSIYEMFFKKEKIRILLQLFSGKCVKESGFFFGEKAKIPCDLLARLSLSEEEVVSGYFYVFHVPEISDVVKKEISLLEQCYMENWQISFLDAGREYIRDYLFRKHNVRRSYYVTDSFGAGYYGMPIEANREIFRVFDGTEAGVRLLENGNMAPLKSNAGMYLVLTKDVSHLMGHDCMSCSGSKFGCNVCRARFA